MSGPVSTWVEEFLSLIWTNEWVPDLIDEETYIPTILFLKERETPKFRLYHLRDSTTVSGKSLLYRLCVFLFNTSPLYYSTLGDLGGYDFD